MRRIRKQSPARPLRGRSSGCFCRPGGSGPKRQNLRHFPRLRPNFRLTGDARFGLAFAPSRARGVLAARGKAQACPAEFAAGEGKRVHGTFGWILQALLPVSRSIDAFNLRLGKWVSWLILAMVLISATNATVRKVFDTSSNSWLELQWVLFSVVFLLCAPWTLQVNEHIRIDIVNNMLPKRVRNVIDVVGHAFFLLPLSLLMIVTGLPFFLRSFEINEQSMNAGGLPQWPAKSLVLLGFFFLFIQGISELVKRLAIMRGLMPDTETHTAHEVVIEEAKRLIEDIKTGTEAH
jgi:TRAP-type mannitol/chloroaromatic compound transport system permease small subunit